MSGSIPAELGDLTYLEQLGLTDNRLSGSIPAELGDLTNLQNVRFALNSLTGCVPLGLRHLLGLSNYYDGTPAHDFIEVDANNDGDTNDEGDVPGLDLPFCMLRTLTLSNGTLTPEFATGTTTYTASVGNDVETTVTATTHNTADSVSITKGADTYTSGTVAENTPAGLPICAPVAASDPDVVNGDTLTYTPGRRRCRFLRHRDLVGSVADQDCFGSRDQAQLLDDSLSPRRQRPRRQPRPHC